MPDALAALFDRFDRGRLSRRQLLMALGAAVAARPVSTFAQGQCGGARAGTPECDPTPAKLPFEPTGWKTVLLDHLSCQVVDYPKEAAYYAALMNWTIRSDDGKQALLDIGDWGGLLLRGGYQAPPAPPAAPAPPAGDPAAGGRGGRGGGPRAPRNAAFDSFCWGIEPWDAKKVEAELRKRGLTPVADNVGKDFQSFHVKDPGRLRPADQQRQPEEPPAGTGERQNLSAGAVRTDELEDGLARSHFVRGLELQGDRRLLHGAARLEAGDGRGQSEPVRNRRRRRHHHPPGRRRQPGRRRGHDAGAPRARWATSRSASPRSIRIR